MFCCAFRAFLNARVFTVFTHCTGAVALWSYSKPKALHTTMCFMCYGRHH